LLNFDDQNHLNQQTIAVNDVAISAGVRHRQNETLTPPRNLIESFI